MVHRLVLGCWLPRLGAVLLCGLAIYSAVELVDLANAAGPAALLRYPFKLPLAFVLVAPIALLASATWALVHLVRTGQTLALSAAGVDPRRALAAVPVLGVAFGLGVFLVADQVSPRALATYGAAELADRDQPRWVASGRALYRLGRPAGDGFEDVLLFVLDERGGPEVRVEAAAIRPRSDGTWQLESAVVTRTGELASPRVEAMAAPEPVPAAGLVAEPELAPGPELRRAAAGAGRAGRDPAPLGAELGLRLSLGLVCPICALIGALAGFRLGRRPALAAAATALAALVCWLAIASSWALGACGLLGWQAVAFGPAAALGGPALLGWLRLPR